MSAAPEEATATVPKEPEPASWKGRIATRITPSSREIKLLRPICQACEDAVGGRKYLQPMWQESCTHDPYVSYADSPRQRAVYKDETDPETGGKILDHVETVVTTKPIPNWFAVTHSEGVNSSRGVEMALLQGAIYPQQLRSPVWPNGIKRRCQFRDCYNDVGLHRYNSGWFCRRMEAKMVRISDLEEPLRIGQFTQKAVRKRQQQLDAVVIDA